MATLVVASLLSVAPSAQADFSSLYGGNVTCAVEASKGDVRLCGGTTTTWDGTKIDVDVILPPEPSGADGPYPLIGDFHGWGGEKIGLTSQTERWAEEGYAVFSMSDRGWGQSCGNLDLEKLLAACEHGYNHLMDDRYEVRDAQYLIGELADEGVAEPRRIGATGESYGGGISMALAALRNRTMEADGSLVPWVSPNGKSMEIAAAVPQWPWTDLAYALMPNGRNLDYVAESPYWGPLGDAPIGIEKKSFDDALYATGQALSNYSTTDSEADLPEWFARIELGEPYEDDSITRSVIDQLTTYHSSYYIDHAEAPAPLLIQSGWNDDLFPPDEALRFYERTRTQYPGDPISLLFLDDGHARSQNKEADAAVITARLEAWFDHYLKGEGAEPTSSVETLTTVCGGASGGPYTANDWREIQPGEIRLDSAAAQTIEPGSGSAAAAVAFNPDAVAGGDACATTPATSQTGVAEYSLAAAPEGGFTLMGSPTIIADLESPGSESELAARLVDVSPEGTESLVARALYRPTPGSGQVVFQLHPQGYHFAAGHVAKLELLPSDSPYGRASNDQEAITVSDLELRLPVVEQPGALGGLVQAPAPKVVPPGYELSAEYAEGQSVAGGSNTGSSAVKVGITGLAGRMRATRRRLLVPLRCHGEGACSGRLSVTVRRGRAGHRVVLGRGAYSIAAGRSTRMRLSLTKGARRLVASLLDRRRGRPERIKARLELEDSGRPTRLMLSRAVRLPTARHRHRSR
ncbi:MAG: CocE/NonD family hydrolase [Solirubrobacterales bacterium]